MRAIGALAVVAMAMAAAAQDAPPKKDPKKGAVEKSDGVLEIAVAGAHGPEDEAEVKKTLEEKGVKSVEVGGDAAVRAIVRFDADKVRPSKLVAKLTKVKKFARSKLVATRAELARDWGRIVGSGIARKGDETVAYRGELLVSIEPAAKHAIFTKGQPDPTAEVVRPPVGFKLARPRLERNGPTTSFVIEFEAEGKPGKGNDTAFDVEVKLVVVNEKEKEKPSTPVAAKLVIPLLLP